MFFILKLLRLLNPLKWAGSLIRILLLVLLVVGFIQVGGLDAVAAQPQDGVQYQQEPTETPTSDTDDGDEESEESQRSQVDRLRDFILEDENAGEQQENPFEQTLYEFNNGLVLHSVEYDAEEGVARIYLSAESDGSILIVDGTLEQSGAPNTINAQLVEGQTEIYELRLANIGNEHISLWAGDDPYYHFGQSDYRLGESVSTAEFLAFGAIGSSITLLLGLHYLKRGRKSGAESAIDI